MEDRPDTDVVTNPSADLADLADEALTEVLTEAAIAEVVVAEVAEEAIAERLEEGMEEAAEILEAGEEEAEAMLIAAAADGEDSAEGQAEAEQVAEDAIEAADEAIEDAVEDSVQIEEAAEEAIVEIEEAAEEAVEEIVEAVIEEVIVEAVIEEAIEELIEEEADEAIEAEAAAEVAAAKVVSPYDGPGDWYVVHTYAGYENRVKTNLASRIHSMQMQDKIFDIHIPMEDVMEIKGGKKQVVKKKVFPGYLLVKMDYDNDSWYVVRNTPGVTGFVSAGTGTKPTPLSRREVEKILLVKEEEAKPVFRLEWEEGDVVRIISGPFADFNGTISEINVDQSKLKVLVNIFDRETPVELGFDQVAKV